MSGQNNGIESNRSVTEKSYKFSSLDQLKNILKESGWKNDEFTRFFGSSGVTDPFKERELTESQIKTLATKLDTAKTQFEQRALLRQIAMGQLIEGIGEVYSFASITELADALKQRDVVFPKEYLGQPGSTFVNSFAAPRHLAKSRYDQLISDLAKIQGDTYKNNADRGELIRLAFGDTVPTTSSLQAKTPSTPTNTDPISVIAGQNEIKEAKEKIKELDMKNIETFIKLSNVIINRFSGTDKMTIQGIRGSYILEKIQSAGLSYVFDAKGIQIRSTDPKLNAKSAEVALVLDTMMKTGNLTVDELKYGLLYTTPSFEVFANNSRLTDGTPNNKVTIQSYTDFLKQKPVNELTLEEKSVLESGNSLTKLNVPELVRSFQNLGQVGSVISMNPELATQVAKMNNIATTPSSIPSQPAGMVQNGANVVAGTAGTFAGKTAENIGDFAGGVSQALSKGFEKGGAIGGLAVAVIGIMGAWKFLTGEWGTKNHKLSGWMIALLGFGGKAAYDMASEYGLMDKAKDVAGNAGKTIKGATKSLSKSDSDSADLEEDKSKEKSLEKTELTPTQIEATKRINADTHINGLFNQNRDKFTATKDQYISFINKELKEKPISILLNPKEPKHSITSMLSTLDPSISVPTGIDPAILKYMLRVYILGLSVKPSDLVKSSNQIKSAVDKFDLSKDTLLTATQKTYNTIDKIKEDISKKIHNYEILMNNEVLSKDNLKIQINQANEGGYVASISVIDPKKIKTTNITPDSIVPFKVDFDDEGKLETTTLKIMAKVGPLTPSRNYNLSQKGNQILIQEA